MGDWRSKRLHSAIRFSMTPGGRRGIGCNADSSTSMATFRVSNSFTFATSDATSPPFSMAATTRPIRRSTSARSFVNTACWSTTSARSDN
jgi:hypothetical protein